MTTTQNKISDDWMSYMWAKANQVQESIWDGYFGMETHDWEEAGVTQEDDVHVVISKVNKYIDAHISPSGQWIE